MNPFYERAFDVAPNTFARSAQVEAEFERIEQGFDGVKPFTDDITAARQGQASLLLNLQRYLSTFAPSTASLDMGGFLVRNVGAPLLGGDLATKAYVDSLVITATAPQWLPTETLVNKTLVPFESCTVKALGVEVTLPAAPTYGVTKVRVRVAPGMTARVMQSGGLPIQGVAEDMDMIGGQWVELQAESATEGWVIA
jgi:hypothetical protein